MELIRTQASYIIRNAPAYGTLGLTPSSDRLKSPQAFEYSKEYDGRLQSLSHAIITRIAFHNDRKKTGQDLDYSNEYQKTNTISIKFKEGKRIVTAFAELENDEPSFILLTKGYQENHNSRELFVPIDDPFISRLIQIARENNRITPAQPEIALKLSTKRASDQYSRNKTIIAAIGSPEIAELNAEYLDDEHYELGHLYNFPESKLEILLNGKERHALIRPVGLGGGNNDVHYINTTSLFNIPGRARAIINRDRESVYRSHPAPKKMLEE